MLSLATLTDVNIVYKHTYIALTSILDSSKAISLKCTHGRKKLLRIIESQNWNKSTTKPAKKNLHRVFNSCKEFKLTKMVNYKNRFLTKSKTSFAVLGKTAGSENWDILCS